MAKNRSSLRKTAWWFLAVLAAGLLASPFIYHRLAGTKVKTVRPLKTKIAQTVVATGRVGALARVELASTMTGAVAEVLAGEGDSVQKGAPLVKFRDDGRGEAVNQARALTAQSEAALEQADKAVKRAEASLLGVTGVALPLGEKALQMAATELDLARLDHERAKSLFEKGYISRAELDRAEGALNLAGLRLAQRNTETEAKKEGGAELKNAQAALEEARAAHKTAGAAVKTARAGLSLALAKAQDLVIKAPADGVIIERLVEKGDVAMPGRTLLVLSRKGKTEIITSIDEKNLPLLKEGQDAAVSADAFPKAPFKAVLSTIVPAVLSSDGTVKAKFDVPEPPPFLLPDMTVSVETEVARKTGALTLPANAVRDQNGKEPWVMTLKDGYARRVPVTIGIRGEGLVEVTGGVTGNDLVVPMDQELIPGERARSADAL